MHQTQENKGLKGILRFPRLDTVLMVEAFIREHDGEYKKKALWENLPKGTMYQTFCVIIDYLLYSRKISIDAEGKIGWIYYPESANRFYNRTDLKRK
ncbi:MAG TPA: hypothetical protein VJK51_00510 [Candidatus Nanoarchaeia archaeon]|nr:hypothetical protein [Candidatus Nanoarchaeia archaeon]